MKSDDSLSVGNKVMLNSSGPVMTIESEKNDIFTCAWMNQGEKMSATFPKPCVHKVD